MVLRSFVVGDSSVRVPKDILKSDDTIGFKLKKSKIKKSLGEGEVFWNEATKKSPEWLPEINSLVSNKIELDTSSSVGAVIVFKIAIQMENSTESHYVALPFGVAWHWLNEDVLISDFGQNVASKLITNENTLAVNSVNVTDAIYRFRRELVTTNVVPEFALGRSEYVRLIEGKGDLGGGLRSMSGLGAKLKINKYWDASGLKDVAQGIITTYKNDNLNFEKGLSAIVPVSGGSDKVNLQAAIFKDLKNDVHSFRYSIFYNDSLEINDNVENIIFARKKIAPFDSEKLVQEIHTLIHDQQIDNYETLKQKQVTLRNANLDVLVKKSIHKIMTIELTYNDGRYVYIDGEYLRVDNDFQNLFNREIDRLVKHDIQLPTWSKNDFSDETEYNDGLEAFLNGHCKAVSMHRNNFNAPGETYSKIEPGDVLTSESIYFVKKWAGSSTFSHLLEQVKVVADQLALANESDFNKWLQKVYHDKLGVEFSISNLRNLKLVLTVAGIKNVQDLSFFSKVALADLITYAKKINVFIEFAAVEYIEE